MWALQDLFRFPAVTGPPPPGQQDPALLQSIRRPRSSRKGRVRGLINRGGGVESSGPERGLDSGDSWLAMWPIRKGRGFGLVARDRPGARGGTPISRQKPKMLLGRKSPVPPPSQQGWNWWVIKVDASRFHIRISGALWKSSRSQRHLGHAPYMVQFI